MIWESEVIRCYIDTELQSDSVHLKYFSHFSFHLIFCYAYAFAQHNIHNYMILFFADTSKLHGVTNFLFFFLSSHTIKRAAAYAIPEDDLLLKRQDTMNINKYNTAIFVNVCVSICILFPHLHSTEAQRVHL